MLILNKKLQKPLKRFKINNKIFYDLKIRKKIILINAILPQLAPSIKNLATALLVVGVRLTRQFRRQRRICLASIPLALVPQVLNVIAIVGLRTRIRVKTKRGRQRSGHASSAVAQKAEHKRHDEHVV